MKKIAVLAVVSLFSLSSCAFLFGEVRDEVKVKASNGKAATCKIRSGKEIWNITTPSVIRVDKSTKNIRISCSQKGGSVGYKLVKPKPQEGFENSYEYPEQVTVKMYVPKKKATPDDEAAFLEDEGDKPLNRLPDAPQEEE